MLTWKNGSKWNSYVVFVVSAFLSTADVSAGTDGFAIRYALVDDNGKTSTYEKICTVLDWCDLIDEKKTGIKIRIRAPDGKGSSFYSLFVSCRDFLCSFESGRQVMPINDYVMPVRFTFYEGAPTKLELTYGKKLGEIYLQYQR